MSTYFEHMAQQKRTTLDSSYGELYRPLEADVLDLPPILVGEPTEISDDLQSSMLRRELAITQKILARSELGSPIEHQMQDRYSTLKAMLEVRYAKNN